MFVDPSTAKHRLGYLILRDGHAVPLSVISVDEIKAGAKHRFPHPDADDLPHRRCLDAIVDRLGFPGDFGTFKNEGFPAFERFLKRHGCTHRVGVFPRDHGGCTDLHFSALSGPQPRQLADRIFHSGLPIPSRVFLGYGVNWKAWDGGNGIHAPLQAIALINAGSESAARLASELFKRRHDLMGQWGFLDDKLINGPVKTVVDKSYWPLGYNEEDRQHNASKTTAAVKAFRAVFDLAVEGWVDVIKFNENLVVLRAPDGGWDLLWRNYREKKPPEPIDVSNGFSLSIEDMPSRLMTESDRRRQIHFRQDVWEEKEAHAAEQAFYDRGGSALERQRRSDADVMFAWLCEQMKLPKAELALRQGNLPSGFSLVELDNGRRIAVSKMVTAGEFRRMLAETGYGQRRFNSNEPWDRANDGVPDDLSVGASWNDAQAFCAWSERQHGVTLRLPTRVELRLIRPAFSAHYERLAKQDFPWEDYPPRPLTLATTEQRLDVPSSVAWSEPRFMEPTPDLPEFPENRGLSSKTRKRWISDFPPSAGWVNPMPLAKYMNLDFIDAWDVYEWCQERGWVNGRFWEGTIGASGWGAYKNFKTTFRLVIDLEGDAP